MKAIHKTRALLAAFSLLLLFIPQALHALTAISLSPSFSVRENEGQAVFTAKLSAPAPPDGTRIIFTLSEGTATQGEFADFTAQELELLIPEGEVSGSVTVTINNDDLYETSENFFLTAIPGVDQTIIGSPVTCTILDDGDTFDISIDENMEVTEGEISSFNLNVTLSQTVPGGVTISFSIYQGLSPAQSGIDYTIGTASPLVLSDSQTTAQVQVNILNDSIRESTESLVVGLDTTHPSANFIKRESAITIIDNDFLLTVTSGNNGSASPEGSFTIADKGQAVITITPEPDYCVRDVRENGESVGAVETHTIDSVTRDTTVHAEFRTGEFIGRINPEEARTYGRWRLLHQVGEYTWVDDSGWLTHDTAFELPCHDSFRIEFKAVPGWITPDPAVVNLTPQTTEIPVVTGTYGSKTHVLSYTTTGNGNITLDPTGTFEGDAGTYLYQTGTAVEITANAEAGWNFVEWSGNASGTDPVTTISMDSDKTIAALFVEDGADHDGDGFPVENDCNDNDETIHPGAPEICGDAIDQDCNGSDQTCGSNDIDNDGDGYTENMGDCNDNNKQIHPGASDVCGDGIDQDCYDGDNLCHQERLCTDLADIPLASQAQSAPANIMFLLDDSGSMDWEFMTRENDGLFSGKYYVFSNPGDNAYTSSSRYMGSSDKRKWKSQWYGYNMMYYNPNIIYAPWPRWNQLQGTDGSGGSLPFHADPDSPRSNPVSSNRTFNLGGTYLTVIAGSETGDFHKITVIRENNQYNNGSSTLADAVAMVLSSNYSVYTIVDNKDDEFFTTGSWNESGSPNEYAGSAFYTTNYGNTATWFPNIPQSGYYRIYAWVNEYYKRDQGARYTIHYSGGSADRYMNQAAEGGKWYFLGGPYYFTEQEMTGSATGNIQIYNSHYYESTMRVPISNLSGSFSIGDTVSGERSEASGEIIEAASTHIILARIKGTFKSGETISRDPDNSAVISASPSIEDTYLINLNQQAGTIDHYLFNDMDSDSRVDDGELFTMTAEEALAANINPENEDGTPMTYVQARQNFADWYSFYRRRELAAKAAVGEVINDTDGINIGLLTIHNRVSQPVLPVDAEIRQIVSDNLDSTFSKSGSWYPTSSSGRYRGSTLYSTSNSDSATWTPEIPQTGLYKVYAWWNSISSRDPGARYTITYDGGTQTDTLYVDQSASYGSWKLLGTYQFTKGTSGSVRLNRSTSNKRAVADAVKFEPISGSVLANSKEILLSRLYSINSSGGTPLRLGLQNIGKYFDKSDSAAGGLGYSPYNDNSTDPSPFLKEEEAGGCQKAYVIMMTDGYYNGGTPSPTVGNADGDGTLKDGTTPSEFDGGKFAGENSSNTLADISMYYYENDLAPGLSDSVPVGNNPKAATHQHMTTYSVSFGVFGLFDPKDYEDCPLDCPADENYGDCPTTGLCCPCWEVPDSNTKKIDDLYHAAVNGRGKYLSAGDPLELITALKKIKETIDEDLHSGASVSINTQKLTQGTTVFQATYLTVDWTGDIVARCIDTHGDITDCTCTDPVTGSEVACPDENPEMNGFTAKWSAKDQLAAGNWSERKIITANRDTGAGVPFAYDSLSSSQKTALSPVEDTARKIVSYIRGYQGDEGTSFRTRNGILGDFAHSSPSYIKNVTGDTSKGVVYAGSNDGMLHAFDETTGNEIFAYVPDLVLDNLHRLTADPYTHTFYVDASPYTASFRDTDSDDISSYLVSGLGKGGKGVFCLNISNVSSTGFNAESSAATLLRWEYPDANSPDAEMTGIETTGIDPDMGFTYGGAFLVRSNAASVPGPVAIFGNGYQSDNNRAVLYIINAGTGDVIRKIDTGSGNASACNGLSTPQLIDVYHNNMQPDGLVDYVYAGDLLGNLWKFDLTDEDPANWHVAYQDPDTNAPKPLFQAKNSNGHRQPITVQPDIIKHCGVGMEGYLVIFGTGRYNGLGDLGDASTQSIYGIWDWAEAWKAAWKNETPSISDTELATKARKMYHGDFTPQRNLSNLTDNPNIPETSMYIYTIDLSKADNGDTVTLGRNDLGQDPVTFTLNTESTIVEERKFSLSGGLAYLVNDDTYGVDGIYAISSGETVIFWTNPASASSTTISLAATGDIETSSVKQKVSLLQQVQEFYIENSGIRIISDNSINWYNPYDLSGDQLGWYFDLPANRERVVQNIIAREGIATVISSVPEQSPCSAGGYSFVHALSACNGGRFQEAIFDIDGNNMLDTKDTVTVNPSTGNKYSPTGLKKEGMWYTPSILALPSGAGDIALSPTSAGKLQKIMLKAEQVGFFYWREIIN